MRDKDKKNNEKEPDKDLTAAYTDEAWSEEYINELLYEDEIPARKPHARRPMDVKQPRTVIVSSLFMALCFLSFAVSLPNPPRAGKSRQRHAARGRRARSRTWP